MGEKIRDLHPIKVGSAEFMIELNEGGTKAEGRVIHVQNKHFRYLINEKGFMNLATTFLRARSEMDYFKSHHIINRSMEEFEEREEADGHTYAALEEYAEILKAAGIDYRFIETGKKYVTFIVDNNFYRDFRKVMDSQKRYKKWEHPFGNLYGFQFLYQLREFEIYEKDGVYIEIYFQLPCMSLMPKIWIPLDRRIQGLVWKEHGQNISGVDYLSVKPIYIYRLCWAVFKDHGFSAYTRKILSENKSALKEMEMVECLKLVFFKFTDDLVELLERECYDQIIPSYYSFDKY